MVQVQVQRQVHRLKVLVRNDTRHKVQLGQSRIELLKGGKRAMDCWVLGVGKVEKWRGEEVESRRFGSHESHRNIESLSPYMSCIQCTCTSAHEFIHSRSRTNTRLDNHTLPDALITLIHQTMHPIVTDIKVR